MISRFAPIIYQQTITLRPSDILNDSSLQASHDRLRKYELTWAYVDEIFAGVVWVSRDYGRSVLCWCECVAENDSEWVMEWDGGMPYLRRKTISGMDWYRKYILYEMTTDCFDRVKAKRGRCQ